MPTFLKANSLRGRTVLVRVDLNEPVDESGNLLDDFRIRAVLPTLELLRSGSNRLVLCAHLGRPEGKVVSALSLRPVAERLSELMSLKLVESNGQIPDYPIEHLVFYTGDLRDSHNREQVRRAAQQNVVLLENIRFYPEEEQQPGEFAKLLAELGQSYVNDAFSVCHHRAASVVDIAKLLPSYGGPLLEREIKFLSALLGRHQDPFVALMGGIKISGKVETLENLGRLCGTVLLGGGLANLFFLADGLEVGASKVERGAVKEAWQLKRNFKDKIVLPEDVVVAKDPHDRSGIRVKSPYEVKSDELILDIGPKTILRYAQILRAARTIVWNGPLGHFEVKPFHTGTMALAQVIGGVATRTAFAVVGGGETVDAVRQAKQLEHMDHVSTGGGAMLEVLAGKDLPGVTALG